MTVQAVLLPVFVLVALTFGLLFWLGPTRLGAVKRGEVRPRDVALGEPNWPSEATQIGNAYLNQFQLPVLFYVLVAFALFTRKTDLLFVVFSWIFVATRLVHAFIHTTSNDLRLRFGAFLIGAIVLFIMWITFALGILFARLGPA